MKPTLVLCAVLLAACGPDASDAPEGAASASDSAALDAVTQPSAGQSTPGVSPAVDNVNRRLDQAEKDAAARQNEALEQVRRAEGGMASP